MSGFRDAVKWASMDIPVDYPCPRCKKGKLTKEKWRDPGPQIFIICPECGLRMVSADFVFRYPWYIVKQGIELGADFDFRDAVDVMVNGYNPHIGTKISK